MITKEKALKALKLLFVGELFVVLGLLGELGSIYQPLALISLIAIVGMIIALIGIIKLRKVNIFFLISCLAIAAALAVGILSGVLAVTGIPQNVISIINDVANIVGKGFSFVFVFGIIRGCAKAATGSARGKIATIMSLINFSGKALAILFAILAGIYEKNEGLANGFVLASTFSTIAVDLAFVCFLFIICRKASKIVKGENSSK